MQFFDLVNGYYLYLSTSPDYSIVTAKFYKQVLSRISKYLGNPEIQSLSKNDIQQYFADLKNGNASIATYYRYWQILNVFFKWVESEMKLSCPELPNAPKRRETEIIPFSTDDIKKIVKATTTIRNQAIVFLLLDTGIRAGELCRLKVSDLNLETGEIIIRPFQTGVKSRKRSVWLGGNTTRVIWKYLATRNPRPEDPLLSTKNNTPLERYGLRHILQRIGKKAGVQDIYPHRFRHTFAIEYLRNGGDVFTLKRILGHSRLVMTEKYLLIANSDVQKAHQKASPVDNLKLH